MKLRKFLPAAGWTTLAFAGFGAGAAIALVGEVPGQSPLADTKAQATKRARPRALRGCRSLRRAAARGHEGLRGGRAAAVEGPRLADLSDQHEEPGGAELLRPGPPVRHQFQPRRSTARVRQGTTPGSDLRDVFPGRGTRARAEYQRADGSRSERAGSRRRSQGAGAFRRRKRQGESAHRSGGRSIFRGSGGGTTKARTPPSRTPWRRCRTSIRTTSSWPCWPPRREWIRSPGTIGSRAARLPRGGRPMSRSGWKRFSRRAPNIPGQSTSTSISWRPRIARNGLSPMPTGLRP